MRQTAEGVYEVAPGHLLTLYDIGAWGEPVRYIGARDVWLGVKEINAK